MKYLLLFLLVHSLYASHFKLSLGTGLFSTEANGNLVYAKSFWEGSSSKIEHENSASTYLFAELRHDIAFLPNIRIEQTRFQTKGQSNIHIATNDASINELVQTLNDLPLISINDIYYESTLAQTQNECYLFYSWQKEQWPLFDIGAGIDRFTFDYAVTIIEGLQFNDNGEQDIPMLYVHSQYEAFQSIKDVTVLMGGTMKYYAFGPSNVYDASLETTLLWPFTQKTKLGFTLGFRRLYMHLKGDDIETVGGKIRYNGAYAGVRLDFN